MKDLCRQLPDFGRLAYPMRGEVTNRAVLGRKRHGRPEHFDMGAQRWGRPGWQQTRRPEDQQMTAAAKILPALKSLSGMKWSSRPAGTLGKADVAGEETEAHPVSHRGRGPSIRGKVCRDNAGKGLGPFPDFTGKGRFAVANSYQTPLRILASNWA